MAILEDHGIATIDDILRRLAEATTGIDIAADGSGTLLGEQRLQISVLAYQFIAGREVQDDVGTRQRQVIAGRNGGPDILADLRAELHAACSHEYLWLWRNVDRTTCKVDIRRNQILCRGKPSFLVELAVVGQVGLWHDAQQ